MMIRTRRTATIAIAVVVAGLAVAILSAGLSGNNFVDRLTVVNRTAYDLDVDVTDGARSGWTGIGTAQRDGVDVFEQVLDQGDTWIFRFTYGGVTAGEMRRTRADLRRDSWRLEVAAEMAGPLETAGITPPPKR